MMHCKKHKRKTNHVVIVTSDAVDGDIKQFKIKPWMRQVFISVLCIVVGALVGYGMFEAQLWDVAVQQNSELREVMKGLEEDKKVLEDEKKELQSQIDGLNEEILILSETVNQKVQSENELTATLEAQKLPTVFPLNGSASMQELTEGNPMCVFTASPGIMVVATGSGTVMAVNDDSEYGHNVWIDHGNGYVTIYRNKGDVIVKQGDEVVQGTTLFIIGENNTALGYQMMKDNTYISPMEMLAISG